MLLLMGIKEDKPESAKQELIVVALEPLLSHLLNGTFLIASEIPEIRIWLNSCLYPFHAQNCKTKS